MLNFCTMTFKQIASVIVMTLLCFGAQTALAESIDLVSGNDYAPYAGNKLKDGGLTSALVKKAFTEMGDETTVTWMGWSRGYAEVKRGNFSATYPYTKTDARAAEMLFSDPIVSIKERVYVKKGFLKLDSDSMDVFAGSTMCLAAGGEPHPKLVDLFRSGKLKRLAPSNVSGCIDLVNAGLADFFVLEERLIKAALKGTGLPESAIVLAKMAPLSETHLYLVAPKIDELSAELIAKFNHGLQKMRADGSYDAIVKSLSP